MDKPTKPAIDQRLLQFRSLLDSIPFEEVIGWVYDAPAPKPASLWRQWWYRRK